VDFCFFFFQAEDGIRDRNVTGVQTCALPILRPGDEIIVQTKDGFYTYTFRNFDIILPDAVEVLSPVPDEPEYKGKDRILTMTACNPMFSARERYVAYAELTDWTPAQDGRPESIEDSKAYDKVTENGGA